MSDELDMKNGVAEALAKAQAMFRPVPKDKVNPHFNSRYSSLDAIIEATREGLTTNGLALTHRFNGGETMTIEAVLMGHGGELRSGEIPILLDKQTMQGLGGAITYARRYTAGALLGVCSDEDDDGNAASKNPFRGKAKKPEPAPAEIKPAVEPKAETPIFHKNRKWTTAEHIESCETPTKLASKLNLWRKNNPIENDPVEWKRISEEAHRKISYMLTTQAWQDATDAAEALAGVLDDLDAYDQSLITFGGGVAETALDTVKA